MRFSAAQSSEPFGCFARNERFKSQAHELRLFLNAGELGRAFNEMVINVECCTHMYEHAWVRHQLSRIGRSRYVRFYYPAMAR